MPPIKLGIIGYGGSAKIYHLPFIVPNPDLEVHAFLQRAAAPSGSEPGSHCTIDYPNAKHYRSADDFFADAEIELVVVCSHTDTHAEFAERALRAGKHVVVEKPFTRTSEEADRLIAVAKEEKKVLACFQNRRYDADFLTLKTLLGKGAFGEVTEFENHYDVENPSWISNWPDSYTPGEGMLFGLGSHSLDQALVLFGRPKRVTAFLRSLRSDRNDADDAASVVDDTFTVILEYDGEQKNLLVTVKTAIVSPMQAQMTTFIRGTNGSFLKFGPCVQEEHIFQGLHATDPAFGIEDKALNGVLTTYELFDTTSQKYDEASKKYIGKFPTVTGRYLGYYENIVGAIRGDETLQIRPEQSRDNIRLIELARESNMRHAAVEWS